MRRAGLAALLGALALLPVRVRAAGTAPGAPPSAAHPAPVVLLDPGHGGTDPGVTAGGLRECDVTLALAQRVAALLKAAGVDARLTRDGDESLSVSARVAEANALQPEALVSIHVNAAFQTAARGPRLFVPAPGGPQDLPQAPLWREAADEHAAASRVLGLSLARALGVEGPRQVETLKLALFRGLSVPACLVEVGFATNPADLAALKDPSHLQTLAAELAHGIGGFLASPSGAARARP